MGLKCVLGLPVPRHGAVTLCSLLPAKGKHFMGNVLYVQSTKRITFHQGVLWSKKAVLPSKLCRPVTALQPESHPQVGWTHMLTPDHGTEGPYLEVAMADAVPVASHCSLMMRTCSPVTAQSSLQPRFPLTILRGTCAQCLGRFNSTILFWSI